MHKITIGNNKEIKSKEILVVGLRPRPRAKSSLVHLESIDSLVIMGGVQTQGHPAPSQEILSDIFIFKIDLKIYIKI